MGWEARTVSLILCLSILLATIQHGNAERKIVCYYTNWSIYRPGTAKFSPQNINPYLCTHLIYAFGGFTKDNALKPFDKYQDIEKGGYAKFTGLKTYNKNLKTLLAIGGWNEGSSRFSPMVADPERRRELVKNAVKFLRKNHFDGLDLDWEYPAFRDGGKPRDKDNYASLVQELREEFERESSKTGRPRLLLSLAMPAGIEYIDKGYDIPKLNEYLDFINLLSYDYHSSYEPAVNHHSPLYPLEEDNEYNYDSELTIDYTVNYLLTKGASEEKIILGIPTYGRSYTLFNEDATDLGAPADGPGIEGDATREKGYLAYYEICESLAASDDWEIVQPNPKAMGPYAFKNDQWVGYDDEDIVRLKAKYVNDKKLGGIMFWTIDNDDFRGKCHDRPYPLIEAAKETLLTDSTNTQPIKTSSNRKKVQKVQSNAIGRRHGFGGRRTTTTAASISRKKIPSSRPKFRTTLRSKAVAQEDDDQEVDRRAYDFTSEEEDDDSRGSNAVRNADKSDRARNKGRAGTKSPAISSRSRRKQNRRKGGNRDSSEEESLSNNLTTPEPPTTPDPGTDFKCEDEGFFSHPRDCKKYFWCLDSGPGGLGVVAHQFTCPSGLVFNKAADSCDYPRNVVCPKSKTSQSAASTTRAPITAATSRTTYLYSTTRKPTTEKPESEEEYEYYDDEDEADEEANERKKEKEISTTTATPKPLLYKTISRNRSTTTTTTTTTTTEAPSTTSKSDILAGEDEEDPRVIKELIKLIKKAGGLEQLEKQLLLQDKNPDETSSDNVQATPATISRSLYERVLNRQTNKIVNKIANRQGTTTDSNYANGPGGAQFAGLDEIPEVKSLRRIQKPQYVTIQRPRSSTKEPPADEVEDEESEENEDETADVASSEEQAVSKSFLSSSTQRVTPNYVNIRRARPSTTTSRTENDVEEKEEEMEVEVASRRRRPNLSSRDTESSSSAEDLQEHEFSSPGSERSSPSTKSRYVNIQRFRSTTPRSPEAEIEDASLSKKSTTESASSNEPAKIEETVSVTATDRYTTAVPLPSTASNVIFDAETERTEANSSVETSSTTESVKLVEESATEILLTTVPSSPSTLSTPSTRISVATVSQPRPFGFNRRQRPTTEPTTTPLATSSDQTRSKVASSDAIRLPTLKELIGSRTNEYPGNQLPVHLSLLPFTPVNSVSEGDVASSSAFSKQLELFAPKKEQFDLTRGKVDAEDYVEDNVADDEDSSFSNKRRFDREDSSTTTLKPTTMRGTPLVTLLRSQIPRGFYVTKSETAVLTAEGVEETTLSTEFPTERVETVTTSIIQTPNAQSEFPYAIVTAKSPDLQTEITTFSSAQTPNDSRDFETYKIPDNTTTEQPRNRATVTYSESLTSEPNIDNRANSSRSRNRVRSRSKMRITTPTPDRERTKTEGSVIRSCVISSTTPTTPSYPSTEDTNLPYHFETSVDPELITVSMLSTNLPIEQPSIRQIIDESSSSTASFIPNTADSNSESSLAETTVVPSGNPTTLDYMEKDSGNKFPAGSETTIISPKERRDENDEPSSTFPVKKTSAVHNKTARHQFDRRRQRKRPNSYFEFGQRGTNRVYSRHRGRTSIENDEISRKEVKESQQPPRRITLYRGRKRGPIPNADNKVAQTLIDNTRAEAETKKRVPEEKSEENANDLKKEESKVSNAIQAKNNAGEHLGVNQRGPEVNSSKSTVASVRASGNLSTRFRKPTGIPTQLQTQSSNALENHQNKRPNDTDSTLDTDKHDTVDEVQEADKPEKDIDQTSRAQEIAVTLADPPSFQTTSTGRPPFRNALRRKISTTLAPKTDTTTARTTVRYSSTVRDRQKPNVKDRPQQNVTKRPRRPSVIDYDYYEDEEEAVVGKSSLNEKIFLTSKGTIRCLDQGNFAHPYSCKKFITCARMVNGLIIGAEYTCPHKLSFDPVGGICNWSAGLGCKD